VPAIKKETPAKKIKAVTKTVVAKKKVAAKKVAE